MHRGYVGKVDGRQRVRLDRVCASRTQGGNRWATQTLVCMFQADEEAGGDADGG